MIKRFLLPFVLSGVLMGCQSQDEDDSIFVRVKNASFWDYDSIKIGSYNTYFGLDTGHTTPYQIFENGHRPKGIKFYSDTTITVVDTGDVFSKGKVGPGRYTYSMTIAVISGTFYIGGHFTKDSLPTTK